ncbi:MAG: hypothetical protein ACE5I1_12105 [bacterium]
MEETGTLIEDLLANKQTFILLLTAGFGLLAGKILRAFLRIVAYILGFIALLLAGLHYLGIIYIVINFDFLHEIILWVFTWAKGIGVSGHLFFWVPLVYGLRKKSFLRFH